MHANTRVTFARSTRYVYCFFFLSTTTQITWYNVLDPLIGTRYETTAVLDLGQTENKGDA